MSEVQEELGQELTKLRVSARDRLTKKDDGFIAELIDNYEFALALEVMVDAFAKEKLAFTRAEIETTEGLARKMGMYPAILDHYPDGLRMF